MIKLFLLISLNLCLFLYSSHGKNSFTAQDSSQSYSQPTEIKSYKLYVNLDKAPFDSLYLHDYTEDRNILISGKKIKEFTWEITVPDSIVSNSEHMVLLASPYDKNNNSKQGIR